MKKQKINDSFMKMAYLCNSLNWNDEFLSKEQQERGYFAIGGVSAEMFCDSYNQIRGKKETDKDFYRAKAFYENETYGYRFQPGKGNNDKPLNSEGYGYWSEKNISDIGDKMYIYEDIVTMYNSEKQIDEEIHKQTEIWLASPSAKDGYYLCISRSDGKCLDNAITTFPGDLRPAISLSTNIKLRLSN